MTGPPGLPPSSSILLPLHSTDPPGLLPSSFLPLPCFLTPPVLDIVPGPGETVGTRLVRCPPLCVPMTGKGLSDTKAASSGRGDPRSGCKGGSPGVEKARGKRAGHFLGLLPRRDTAGWNLNVQPVVRGFPHAFALEPTLLNSEVKYAGCK